jgi:hypothetical protein
VHYNIPLSRPAASREEKVSTNFDLCNARHESAQSSLPGLRHFLRRCDIYAPHHRSEWLGKITEAGVRRRAEFFYQQFDALQALRQQVRRDLLAESRNHSARKLLRQIPQPCSVLHCLAGPST